MVEEPAANDRIVCIENYMQRNPKTVIIDPFKNVKNVVFRYKTFEILSSIIQEINSCEFKSNNSVFSLPLYTIVREMNPAAILKSMEDANITFPIICKHIEACGTPESHHMARHY